MGTSVRVVHESSCPDIGPVCLVRDEPPNLHDQRIRIGELRVAAEYGLTERLGLRLLLPLKIMDTTITYRRLDGTAFEPDWVGIHHRNETLAGVTDPWLTARVGATAGGWYLTGRLGVTIPLGRTEPNPFMAGHEGREHQHFQFGTGTVNPVIGGEVSRHDGELFTSGYLQALLVPYQNDHGFQAGHRLGGGAAFGGRLFGELRGSIGVDVVHEEAERWDGVVQQDGNLGRTDFLTGVGLALPVGRQLLSLDLRTPVYQRIVGGQLSYPAIVALTISRTLGGPGDRG